MRKLFAFVGTTAGSYLGWALGAHVGTMTAYMASVVAAGAGCWAGLRYASHLEG